jgi:hypothetical protein
MQVGLFVTEAAADHIAKVRLLSPLLRKDNQAITIDRGLHDSKSTTMVGIWYPFMLGELL